MYSTNMIKTLTDNLLFVLLNIYSKKVNIYIDGYCLV